MHPKSGDAALICVPISLCIFLLLLLFPAVIQSAIITFYFQSILFYYQRGYNEILRAKKHCAVNTSSRSLRSSPRNGRERASCKTQRFLLCIIIQRPSNRRDSCPKSNLEYVLNEGRWSHLFLTREALKLLFSLLVDVTHNLK